VAALQRLAVIGGVICVLAGCGAMTSPTFGPQLTLASVSPNVVSTTGTSGTITGTHLEGAAVQVGGVNVKNVFGPDDTIRFFTSPAHTPGSVDITVTTPDGQTATLVNGYTYVSPTSFDANGTWIGHTTCDECLPDFDIRFTIQNDALVSLTCGTTPVILAAPIPISRTGGIFTAVSPGLTLIATLHAATISEGTVSAPGCASDAVAWDATKSGAALAALVQRHRLRR
jgi:hypothetical protein